MSELVFYEKPGCLGNRQQQVLLLSLGHRLEVKDLLGEPWTAGRLRPCFGDRPIAEWFNLSALRIKSGELDIEGLDEPQALALMLDEPLLICRPLLQQGELRQAGFVPWPVLDAMGVSLAPGEDLQSCPMETTELPCGEPV
ncbi:MAG: ArsC/Spx/MgsR family protein [Chromatiales bacterium]|jgi:nitrogenase-associated protein